MKLLLFLLLSAVAHAQNEKSSMMLAKENIATYIEKRLYPQGLYQPSVFAYLGTQKLADSVTVIQTVKHNFCVEPFSAGKRKEPLLCLNFIFYLNEKMEVVMAERIR